ncbi:MAG: hypothetical protein QG639_360 [Patescibacteria group bacterium]|jgi:asparagine N-glycosylation enzyme membrane subunit Stt3|nr:hypothetical protein [Patescibacteria group bacterium]
MKPKKPKQSNKSLSKFLWSGLLLILLVSLITFLSIQPSNSRNWVTEFAILPQVTIENETITIKKIRDWKYSESEILSQDYISRTYNVNDLERVWFLIEPFGKWEGVAHTYFVFDFKDQPPVSFSIEARREEGEEYQAFFGLFKKYELIYLWGTETDFTLRRVVHQKNDVHMYPMTISPEFQKSLFLELAKATQQLETKPRFYNTLTSNCTNNLAYHANNIKNDAAPFHYARFLTGYSGEYVYDLGYIPNDKPYDEVKQQFYINQIVQEVSQNASFSAALRQKLL